MAVSNLPGYIQGYKFQNNSNFYDSNGNYFIDQAGYKNNDESRLQLIAGRPTFTSVGSSTGMVLDNTCQGLFNCPTLWKGSAIFVFGAPTTFTVNGSLYPYLSGGVVAAGTGNARILYTRQNASSYLIQILAAGNATFGTLTKGDDSVYATCMSLDQENRTCAILGSDGTLDTGSAVADNNNAVEGWHDYGTSVDFYAEKQRFGNISGTYPDFSASTNTMVIAEMHFFSGILTAGDTANVETELLALETTYG